MKRIPSKSLKGKLCQSSVVFGIVIGLTFVLVMSAEGEELALSNLIIQNPELKSMLFDTWVRWEQEAPRDVKEEIKILRTGDAAAKIEAAGRLAKMGVKGKAAILALIEAQRDGTLPASEVRQVMENMNKSIVEPLITKLKDNDLNTRVLAAVVLGHIKDTRAVEPLIAALEDNDFSVRWVAAVALGNIRDPRAVEPLITALKGTNKLVSSEAAIALGNIGKPAVEPLITVMKDNDPGVRLSAALALGETKDTRAVEPLIVALKDDDPVVRSSVAIALTNLTGQDFGGDYDRWRQWWENQKSEKGKSK